MKKQKYTILLGIGVLLIAGIFAFNKPKGEEDKFIISYEVDLEKEVLKLYWKDDKNQVIQSIENLKSWVSTKGEKLIFAMNGGMFNKDNSPQGLFIEDSNILVNLDTVSGKGNFYLKPNGIFYTTTDNQAVVCKTEDFMFDKSVKYATQSGPMLVIDGQIHSAFKEGSKNLNIRNGVGILPNKHIIFAMSKQEMNFYDFANYFKKLGCKNALYLDGFVSRMYLPEKKWIQTDGNFGVIIGITQD